MSLQCPQVLCKEYTSEISVYIHFEGKKKSIPKDRLKSNPYLRSKLRNIKILSVIPKKR